MGVPAGSLRPRERFAERSPRGAPGRTRPHPGPRPAPRRRRGGRPAAGGAPHARAAKEAAADPYRGRRLRFLLRLPPRRQEGQLRQRRRDLQVPASLKFQREDIARRVPGHARPPIHVDGLGTDQPGERGSLDDGLPPEIERVGEILGADGRLDVLLITASSRAAADPVLLPGIDPRGPPPLRRLGLPEIERKMPEFLVRTHLGASRAAGRSSRFSCCCQSFMAGHRLLLGGIFALIRLARRRAGPGERASSARSPGTLLLALLLHRVAVFWIGTRCSSTSLRPPPLRPAARRPPVAPAPIVDVVDRHCWGASCRGAEDRAGLRSRSAAAHCGYSRFHRSRARPGVFGVTSRPCSPASDRRLDRRVRGQKSLENVVAGFTMLANKAMSSRRTRAASATSSAKSRTSRWATRLRTTSAQWSASPTARDEPARSGPHPPRRVLRSTRPSASPTRRRRRRCVRSSRPSQPDGGRPTYRNRRVARPVRAPRRFFARRRRLHICRATATPSSGRAGGTLVPRPRDRRSGRDLGRLPPRPCACVRPMRCRSIRPVATGRALEAPASRPERH